MTKRKGMLLGAAWYPEQDPEGEWESDLARMVEAGFNAVRIGEFCWSRQQTAGGEYTFDWIDRCLRLCRRHGIGVILCTPTAAPPVWLCERYPDLACVAPDGRRGLFGGRRHYSVFHEGYRRECRGIAEALAQRFGHDPAVIGWQLDNEVGSYSTVDCSAPALAAFHRHLAARYGCVAELNRRWGLVFWNQEVERFDQVPAPTVMMCTRNPPFLLEYNRFCLAGMADFLLEQARVMRPHLQDQFIVACAVEPVLRVLYRRQREEGTDAVDAVTVHNYPELHPVPGGAAMTLDRFRGLHPSAEVLALEHQIGSGCTTTGGLAPALRRYWALETLAHGARAILWFHWRRFRAGCEWRHSSVVERDRQPREPFRSLQSIVRDMRRIEPFLAGARLEGDVQVLVSPDNLLGRDRSSEERFWMEIQLPDAWAERFPLWEQEVRRAVYNPLCRWGLTVDFVEEDSKWDPARPLIVPDLDIATERIAERLARWCERGGTVLCFPGAGERDEDGAQRDLCPPGILAPLFGVELKDYYPLEVDGGSAFDAAAGRPAECVESCSRLPRAPVNVGDVTVICDVRHGEQLELKTADMLGTYGDGPCSGQVAMSRRRVGQGTAIYLGAVPADTEAAVSFYRAVFPAMACRETAYRCVGLVNGGQRFAFLLNDTPRPCPLGASVHDLITDRTVESLPAWGVVFVKR